MDSDVLKEIEARCSFNGSLIKHLIYADDFVVFCPSLSSVQHVVNITHTLISRRKLDLNISKTKCVRFQAQEGQ